MQKLLSRIFSAVGIAVAVLAFFIWLFAPAVQLKGEYYEPQYEPIASFNIIDINYGLTIDGIVSVDADPDKMELDEFGKPTQPFMPEGPALILKMNYFLPATELVEPWKELKHATLTYERVEVLDANEGVISTVILIISGIVPCGVAALLFKSRWSAVFGAVASIEFLGSGVFPFLSLQYCVSVNHVLFPRFLTMIFSSYTLGWGAILSGVLFIAAAGLFLTGTVLRLLSDRKK